MTLQLHASIRVMLKANTILAPSHENKVHGLIGWNGKKYVKHVERL